MEFTLSETTKNSRTEETSLQILTELWTNRGFFIIVFSKNYATSEWCLNELLKITECTAEKASKVIIPIFYHVTTSDVGDQERSFKDAFSEHRKNADPEKEKLIGDWEIALKKVSKTKIKGVPVDDQ